MKTIEDFISEVYRDDWIVNEVNARNAIEYLLTELATLKAEVEKLKQPQEASDG